MKSLLPFILGGLFATGTIACITAAQAYDDQETRKRTKPVEVEFVCYEDDKLVERHTGVVSAEEKVSGPAWKLTYAEGGVSIYAQRPGEACTTETVN